MSDVAQVLRDALARLDGGKRWMKGNWRCDENVCILGALNDGVYSPVGAENILWTVALTEYADRQPANKSIALFNDHPDTTWADVERVFEKAIANAEAEL